MLEAIGAGIAARIGDRDWKDVWLDSPEHQKVLDEIAAIKAYGLAKPLTDNKNLTTCKFRRRFLLEFMTH